VRGYGLHKLVRGYGLHDLLTNTTPTLFNGKSSSPFHSFQPSSTARAFHHFTFSDPLQRQELLTISLFTVSLLTISLLPALFNGNGESVPPIYPLWLCSWQELLTNSPSLALFNDKRFLALRKSSSPPRLSSPPLQSSSTARAPHQLTSPVRLSNSPRRQELLTNSPPQPAFSIHLLDPPRRQELLTNPPHQPSSTAGSARIWAT
jgi:hypothetical protein